MDYTITPAESAAVAQAVGGAARAVALGLLSKFPDMNPDFAAWAGRGVFTLGATFGVAVLRWVMVGIGKVEPGAPVLGFWDRARGVLNPLLAAVAGGLGMGDLLGAALPVLLHVFWRGGAKAIGNATPQGVRRSLGSAGAVLLAAGILTAAAPVRAQTGPLEPVAGHGRLVSSIIRTDPGLGPLSVHRFAFTAALGAKSAGWTPNRGTQAFLEGQVGYQWTNALGIRAGVRRETVPRAPVEPELKFTLTFAP